MYIAINICDWQSATTNISTIVIVTGKVLLQTYGIPHLTVLVALCAAGGNNYDNKKQNLWQKTSFRDQSGAVE